MVTLNREQTALYSAHEHLIDETVRFLRRKYPALDSIDPESVGRMALYEASQRSHKVRVSFAQFARVHISTRLREALRTHCRRQRLCGQVEMPLEMFVAKAPVEHSDLYAAIDKLPRKFRKIVAWEFRLLGDKSKTQAELAAEMGLSLSAFQSRVKEALVMLRELLA